GIPAADSSFDRIVAVHVLEHLPDLPAALDEMKRVLRPAGRLVVVLPCEGGLLYGLARRFSAKRLFERRYHTSYDWFIRSEHVNTSQEVVQELRRAFDVERVAYWPLRLPSVHFNRFVGVEARRR